MVTTVETLNSRQVEKQYKISPITLRSWRRGWYTNSSGKHYFFSDKSNLFSYWNAEVRQFEYDALKVAVWSHRLKAKRLRQQKLGGSLTKDQYHRGGIKEVYGN